LGIKKRRHLVFPRGKEHIRGESRPSEKKNPGGDPRVELKPKVLCWDKGYCGSSEKVPRRRGARILLSFPHEYSTTRVTKSAWDEVLPELVRAIAPDRYSGPVAAVNHLSDVIMA